MSKVKIEPWPSLISALTGRVELAWNEEIHYSPPTFECPEEGAYDIVRTRTMFIDEQVNSEELQLWYLYEGWDDFDTSEDLP